MEIVLNLNNTYNSLDLVKYCVLYFDKIKIDAPISIDGVERLSDIPDKEEKYKTKISFTPYISDSLRVVKDVLVEEGICIDDIGCSFGEYTQLAKELVARNSHLFLSQESFVLHSKSMEINYDATIISDEAKNAISEIISQKDRNRILSSMPGLSNAENISDIYLVLTLYKGLVDLMITHIEKGENVATNSHITNEILLSYYSKHKETLDGAALKYNYAIIEATKILLPHIKNASLEDVLDIRYRANDELLELRNYIETTLNSIDDERLLNSSNDEIDELLNRKITPSIRQFERKLQGLDIFTVQEFIKNIKDPKSYAPMLTTFFANVPANASLGFSLGMITLQTILQRKAKKLEIQNDPLYFTIKI